MMITSGSVTDDVDTEVAAPVNVVSDRLTSFLCLLDSSCSFFSDSGGDLAQKKPIRGKAERISEKAANWEPL